MITRIFIVLALFSTTLWSQDSPIRLDRQQYSQLERLWTKYETAYQPFPSTQSIARKKISTFIINLPIYEMSETDLALMRSYVVENPEWFRDTGFINQNLGGFTTLNAQFNLEPRDGLFNTFYQYPSHFLYIEKPDFFLSLNPILHWEYGRQKEGYAHVFENKKGLALRLGIDKKLYIYSKIEDIQFSRPGYIENYIANHQAIPGYNFYSRYKSSLVPAIEGNDVLNAEAYMTLPIGKYISTQFGYGRQFIGSGYQSLLLSDFGPNYLHLKLNIEIWKLKYQFMVAEMAALSPQQDLGDQLLPKKFLATHMLQFRLGRNAHLGLFESVVFGREQQLEWHYLLPVILFRSVERSIGSPDNVLLGLDFQWSVSQKYSLYSQFIMDEFKIKEVVDRNGWWANKFGIQIGAKAFDVFNVENLNLGIEFNAVRPYTYAHRDTITTYTHNNLPLAHPLGSNFREWIGNIHYQPHPKWMASATAYWIKQGLNTTDINYGSDPRVSTRYQRTENYGHQLLQGVVTDIKGIQGRLSYQLWHNAYLDVNLGLRQQDQNKNMWGSLAFRLNSTASGNSIF